MTVEFTAGLAFEIEAVFVVASDGVPAEFVDDAVPLASELPDVDVGKPGGFGGGKEDMPGAFGGLTEEIPGGFGGCTVDNPGAFGRGTVDIRGVPGAGTV